MGINPNTVTSRQWRESRAWKSAKPQRKQIKLTIGVRKRRVEKISQTIPGTLSRMISYIATASAFVGVSLAAESEDKPKAEPKVAGSATVTITAEAHTIEIAKTPNPVVVLDAEKISQTGSSNLARVIDLALPGRTVGNGGVGSVTSLFVNGSRSQDVVVLLDGIRVSDINLGIDFSQFALSGIERVEILSGAASTLYGSDAHGGVVSLFSRGPASRGISGYMLQQTSTLGQVRTGAMTTYSWEEGWLQGAADVEQCPQSTETRKPYRQASGHIGLGWQFTGNWLLTLNHRMNYKGIPLPFNWDYDEYWQPSRKYDYSREGTLWQSITTGSLKGAFNASLYGELNLGNINQENYYTDTQYSANLHRQQGNALLAWSRGKGSFTLLADYKNEKFWNDDADKASTGQHTAMALEVSMEPISVLRFVASARQQWDRLEQYQLPQTSINQTTWKIGANLLLPQGFRSYINAGTAFNAPSLYALGWNASMDKPAVGNERSMSVLAGIGYEQVKWWLKADVSRINYSDLVDFVGGWDTGHFININRIRIQSLELSGGMRGGNWNAEIFIRSQEGRALDLPEEQQLKSFLNRPFFSTGLRAACVIKNVNLGMNASYTGHRYVYNSDIGGVAAEKTHFIDTSLYAAIQLNKALSVTFRAERLLQDGLTREDWETGRDTGRNNVGLLPGFPAPGREFSFEAKYKF